MCWSFQNFSRSVENIAAELDNKVCDVSRRINWLVQHKYIHIKHLKIFKYVKDSFNLIIETNNEKHKLNVLS